MRGDMDIDRGRDTFLSVGEYRSSDDLWRLRESKTVVIQRFWRGFLGRSVVSALRREKQARRTVELEAAQEAEDRRRRQRQRDVHRRMNPTTVRDFEVGVQSEPPMEPVAKTIDQGRSRERASQLGPASESAAGLKSKDQRAWLYSGPRCRSRS